MSIQKRCAYCGGTFTATRKDAKFCSTTHRVKYHKSGGNASPDAASNVTYIVPVEVDPGTGEAKPVEGRVLDANPLDMGEVERLTRRDLEEAGKIDTPIGAACVALARRLDNPRGDTGSAMSSVAARLDDMLTKATRGALAAGPAAAYEDELAARRDGRGA